MKPLNECKAGISSELPYNAQQLMVNDSSASECMDREFFNSLAKLAEQRFAGSHEEDIHALQQIENTYCRSKIAVVILVKVLFLKEDATSELLTCAKRCLSEQEYRFLMDLLNGFTELSEGDKMFPPSPSKPWL